MDKSLPPYEQPKLNRLIIRFSGGAVIGLVLAALYWCSTIYFRYPTTLETGIIGSLGAAVVCGLLAAKLSGKFWKAIEELLPLLPL